MCDRWGALAFVLFLGLANGTWPSPLTAAEPRVTRYQEPVGRENPRVGAVHGDSLQAGGHMPGSTTADTLTTILVFAEGLREEVGQVLISLFATPDGFPSQREKCLQWGVARLLGDRGYLVFEPVRAGHYAVAAFHDEDGNGKMRKDWLGRPKEGWGVSRDAEGHFGPPSFEDAAFEAVGDTLTVHLQLRY